MGIGVGMWGVVCRFQCGWEQLVASWIRAYSYLRCRNAVTRHGWFDSMYAVFEVHPWSVCSCAQRAKPWTLIALWEDAC